MKIQLLNFKMNQTKLLITLLALVFAQIGFAADYPEAGDFQQGSITWAQNCGRCHNIRSANELTDVQWITTVFHMRVRAGLTGKQTRDVVTFLQESNTAIKQTSFSGNASSTNLTGNEIYGQSCIACHGADGKGSLPGVPNFTNKKGSLAKSDAVLIKNITEGFKSSGSAMAMPPKGGNPNLSDKNIKDTLEYLRKQFGG